MEDVDHEGWMLVTHQKKCNQIFSKNESRSYREYKKRVSLINKRQERMRESFNQSLKKMRSFLDHENQ